MAEQSPQVGACYSNGSFGRNWSVRQVIAILACDRDERLRDCVHYKVLVGDDRRKRFTTTVDEFRRWMKYRVTRNENSWERA